MSSSVQTHLIEDEIEYLYLGVEELRSFFSFDFDRLYLSYEDTFPEAYKFAGFSIFRSFDEEVIQRETYDILNFLGDVGGLETVLTIVGGFIIASLINFITQSRFFEKLYYYRPSDNLNVVQPTLESQTYMDSLEVFSLHHKIVKNFKGLKKIILPKWCCRCRSKDNRKFMKLYKKGSSRLD